MSQRIPTRKVPSNGGGGLVASRVISGAPCKLLALIVLNTNAAQQYIQVHERSALPPFNTVPDLPAIPVAGGSVLMFDFGPNGIDLDSCTVCNSSTEATLTVGGADCAFAAIILG